MIGFSGGQEIEASVKARMARVFEGRRCDRYDLRDKKDGVGKQEGTGTKTNQTRRPGPRPLPA